MNEILSCDPHAEKQNLRTICNGPLIASNCGELFRLKRGDVSEGTGLDSCCPGLLA